MKAAANSTALPRKARPPPPPTSKPPPPPPPPSLVDSLKRKPEETTSSSSACGHSPLKKQSRASLLHQTPTLRDVNVYRKQHQVGQGTYGYVILFVSFVGILVSLLVMNNVVLTAAVLAFHWLLCFAFPFCFNRSVFVGVDKLTGDTVALKRINTEQEENGFPITAIREVKILKALDYVNIIQLKEIVTSKGT